MKIEVKLYAALRRYRPKDEGGAEHHPFVVTLQAGATIAALAALLKIPEDLVTAAALNDDAVDVDARLHDGDKVGLFPPSAGGSLGRKSLSPPRHTIVEG